MNRRRWILSALGAGGALLVGWSLLPARSRLGGRDALPVVDGGVALNGWIRIGLDGSVSLVMPRSEMGQGVHTALAMLVAEELDVPLAAVRLEPVGADSRYGNVSAAVEAMLFFSAEDTEPGRQTASVRASHWLLGKLTRELGVNVTGGSSSISDLFPVLPLAAATARAQLLGAASLQWKLPVAEMSVREGIISHPSGPKAHFGEFARAAAITPPGEVQLKPRSAWALVGSSPPRTDLPAKVDGSALFGIDVRQPGQLFAVVRHCPFIDGDAGPVSNIDAVLRMPGVLRVVALGRHAGSTRGYAVVGRTTWHAQQGAQALQVDWQPPPRALMSSGEILDALEAAALRAARGEGGFAFRDQGDVAAASGGREVQAAYRVPYLAHAPMEPINCTARVAGGRVDIWAPTQVPSFARAIAAQVGGVDEAAVTLNVTYLGGGFGRRLEVDFIGQAVRVAMETGGAPVQLLWPREEDLAHDFYRPAGAAVLTARLDTQGQPLSLAVGTAGDAIMPRFYERVFPQFAGPVDPPDRTTAEGLFDLPYRIPHLRVRHEATRHRVPVGSWRSVGHSQNAFFGESFIDELAHAAGADPLAWRLGLLQHLPRHAAVLKMAADQAGWGRPLPAGQARGVALHESFGSIVAMVVEVAAQREGMPRVRRVVAAVDCGTVVHPGIVAQQMESAVVFGLTAALHSRIDIEGGQVRQRNFPDYPLLTLAETPRIETHILRSERAPGGMGEPGTPPVAPALANAIFALTGQRLRELPLKL